MVPLSRALTNDGILLLNFVWPKIKKAMSTNEATTWTDMEREIVSIKKGDDEWTEGPEILQFAGIIVSFCIPFLLRFLDKRWNRAGIVQNSEDPEQGNMPGVTGGSGGQTQEMVPKTLESRQTRYTNSGKN
jgi:hypothetical protein